MSQHYYIKKLTKAEITELSVCEDQGSLQDVLCKVFTVDSEALSALFGQMTHKQIAQLQLVFKMRDRFCPTDEISEATKLDEATLSLLFPESANLDPGDQAIQLKLNGYSWVEMDLLLKLRQGDAKQHYRRRKELLRQQQAEQERQQAELNARLSQVSTTNGNDYLMTVPLSDGGSHEGQLINGKRCGPGTTVWGSGHIYSGNWLNDQRYGYGVQTWPIGDKYSGLWVEDKRCGQGLNTWANGAYYLGQWANDSRNGFGKQHLPTGDIYEGEWTDNKRHGHGKNTWANGRVYCGSWKHDKRNGFGIETLPNGETYSGEHVDDIRQTSFLRGLHAIENTVKECLLF